jgi:hypothetical protein
MAKQVKVTNKNKVKLNKRAKEKNACFSINYN